MAELGGDAGDFAEEAVLDSELAALGIVLDLELFAAGVESGVDDEEGDDGGDCGVAGAGDEVEGVGELESDAREDDGEEEDEDYGGADQI